MKEPDDEIKPAAPVNKKTTPKKEENINKILTELSIKNGVKNKLTEIDALTEYSDANDNDEQTDTTDEDTSSIRGKFEDNNQRGSSFRKSQSDKKTGDSS